MSPIACVLLSPEHWLCLGPGKLRDELPRARSTSGRYDRVRRRRCVRFAYRSVWARTVSGWTGIRKARPQRLDLLARFKSSRVDPEVTAHWVRFHRGRPSTAALG